MWVRSYWRYDLLLRAGDGGGGLDAISSESSSLVLQRSWGMAGGFSRVSPDWKWRSQATDPQARWDSSVADRVVRWRFARFLWASHDPPGERYSLRLLMIPYWSLAAATAVLPIRWLYRFRRDRLRRTRRESGLCATCGYDLRASPGRCPECGTAASSEVAHGVAA